MELQNNRVLTYCPPNFPAQYEILRAFRYCKRVTLQGYYAVSDILLSLAFANQWNSKHSSYVSTRLFCNSVVFRLFCQYSVVCCASVPVFRRCSVLRSSGVPVFRYAFAIACVLLVLVFLPALSGISENSEHKAILQTTKELIQYMVLQIQFRSLKHTTVIRICKHLSNSPFRPKR